MSGSFVSSKASLQFSGNRYCGPSPVKGASGESDDSASKPEELCGCLAELLHTTAGLDPHRSPLPAIHTPMTAWTLVSLLAAPGEPGAEGSRSHVVLIDSMMHQFSSLGLRSVVVPVHSITEDQINQWRTDWNIDPAVQIDAGDTMGLRKLLHGLSSPLLLVSPQGKVVASWQFPSAPGDVWIQIQHSLESPAGTQQMPACQNSAVTR